ncbi:Class I SAM-dependent methyltransferase [Planctomycetales bacterium 10988]|nr:Class I SAM-dependent methyltransferase [Planctomycetales bacterium 10988]
MPFSLDQVVPWGRSYEDYVEMFLLDEKDLRRRLLGCADGPASFNADLTLAGGEILSCDPLYQFSAKEIESRIEACYKTVLNQTRENAASFRWSTVVPDVETLGFLRQQSMQKFLRDYETGKKEGRYVDAGLPQLPFKDQQFELALCSHYLFLYGMLGLPFHLQSIRELCRIAEEVRIFPIVQLDGSASPYLAEVLADLETHGHQARLSKVSYEFQRGANTMLQVFTK